MQIYGKLKQLIIKTWFTRKNTFNQWFYINAWFSKLLIWIIQLLSL
ncbi:hypothetical protein pb186bvf_005858 [Paramecium bursaria]